MLILQIIQWDGNGLLEVEQMHHRTFVFFNPITQGEKFDKNGEYIRRWVPELRDIPNKYIHKPWEAPEHIFTKNPI